MTFMMKISFISVEDLMKLYLRKMAKADSKHPIPEVHQKYMIKMYAY